jgi:hypothetical protein
VSIHASQYKLGVVAIAYAWSCTFCGGSNAAGTDNCANCGRSAVARGIDVEIAKGKVPRRSMGIGAVAKTHRRGLQLLFATVVLLVVALVTLEHFWPVNDRESFGFMILFAAMPWSILALAIPVPFLGAILIAAGIGINAVAIAIVILWWLGLLGFGK